MYLAIQTHSKTQGGLAYEELLIVASVSDENQASKSFQTMKQSLQSRKVDALK
jgi:hypothetical protein